MIALSLLAPILGEARGGVPPAAFSNVAIVPKMLQPGCLFFWLPPEWLVERTELNDAARYATAFVLPPGLKAPEGRPWFEVEDPLAAYRACAALWRRCFDIPVVGVVGSVGKTTTKEMLAHALGGKYRRVMRTRRSENGFVGTAATVFNLRPAHDAAVVEIGIDEVGAMEQHIALVRPNAVTVTRLGVEHLRGLQSAEIASQEELLALQRTEEAGGITIANLDDPWCSPLGRSAYPRRAYYSAGRPAFEVPAGSAIFRAHIEHDSVAITDPAGDECMLPMPLAGAHNGENLLAAAATARSLGLSWVEIEQGLRRFHGARGRSELRRLDSGTIVLCDYMNASPISMAAGLRLLRELGAGGRRTIACLGDMLDLGDQEIALHEALAGVLQEAQPDVVLAAGDRMQHLVRRLRTVSFPGIVQEFGSVAELTAAVATMLQPDDVVLIKGSRGMHMEQIWSGICGGSRGPDAIPRYR